MSFVLLFILLLAAFLTNPRRETHLQELQVKLTEAIDASMSERQNDDPVTYNAWKLGGKQMVGLFTKNYASVDNYYVFSLTRLRWENESYVVGIGAFGNVWITGRIDKEFADTVIDHTEETIKNALPLFLGNRD